ncbi:hypothetical protein CTI12_AA283760 [Artemisia annua]|uniref:Helitron helicase-like domain-containing protein n=1 Tax=Artemisia annua TaxID=35608 RepID=A0A2U1NBZ7_ARTAN|nr:hypothetical protein CTI12_AA283760 [Artemisia annua]
MAIDEIISSDTLMKVALFIIVQALVYLILSSSSNIFSKTAPSLRATSFRTVRSVSIRRIMAALSDLPAGGETSPSIKGSRSLRRQDSVTTLDDHSSPYQPSTSLSQNVSASNFGGLHSMVVSDSGDAVNDTRTNTSCVPHISATAPIGPQNCLAASQSVVQNLHQLHVGVGLNVAAQSCHHPVSAISVDGNAAAFVLVQMARVNESVSAFTVTNVDASFLGAGPDVPAYEGAFTSAVPVPMNEAPPIVPMVLDFSVAGFFIIHSYLVLETFLPGSSGGDAIPTQSPTFATRSLRPRRPRAPASRQHVSAGATRARQTTRAGPSQSINVGNLPMQGPIGPPQREGPPTDYRSFGGCDQVCQHCHAMFWIEEKRTGLPASAAPQYQRSCAGGRVLREDIVQGLIQFLDDNNALVQLFRTARDKLRDGDIPNFQIRLFGVVGSNQHELPTADTIGAIVYEGGPESMTDYDVVIERHSREPESIDALRYRNAVLQLLPKAIANVRA